MGSTGNSFKENYEIYKSSFKNIIKKQTTELANCIWVLKATSRDYKVNRKYYARQIQNTKFGGKLCNL